MPIELKCSCGRDLYLRDELADLTIRCPACAGAIAVPSGSEEIVETVAVASVEAEDIVETTAVGPPEPEEIVETIALVAAPQIDGADVDAQPAPQLGAARAPAPQSDEPAVIVAPPVRLPERVKEPKKKKKKRVLSEYYQATQKPKWLTADRAGIIGGLLCLLAGIALLVVCVFLHRRWEVGLAIGLIVFGLFVLVIPIANKYDD